MSLILDAGALIALERNNQHIWRRLKAAPHSSHQPKTHGGVVAQVWRGGGSRQTRLAQALNMVVVAPLDAALGRKAGVLLASTGLTDAIDAALVALAEHGDQIITSDPDDIILLVAAGNRQIDVLPI